MLTAQYSCIEANQEIGIRAHQQNLTAFKRPSEGCFYKDPHLDGPLTCTTHIPRYKDTTADLHGVLSSRSSQYELANLDGAPIVGL